MSTTKIFLLPILVLILFPITFVLTYTIAVVLDHVNAVFPYISDTGTKPPESCLFGQSLNFGAVLAAFIIYIRKRQVIELNETYNFSRSVMRLNHLSTWFGYTMALGISVVGNFQETSLLSVHMLGALMAFGIGTVYFWMQTYLSYRTSPITCSRILCHLRTSYCIFCTTLFFTVFVCAAISLHQFKGDIMQWNSDDPGYEVHLASTFAEWLLAICFCLFLATFTGEFRRIEIIPPQIIVTTNDSEASEEWKTNAPLST